MSLIRGVHKRGNTVALSKTGVRHTTRVGFTGMEVLISVWCQELMVNKVSCNAIVSWERKKLAQVW